MKYLAIFTAVWLSLASPAAALAQEAGASDTGPVESTGAQGCTGAGCDQGINQGMDQGAAQGVDQGDAGVDVTAENTNTGADSDNTISSDANTSSDTTVNNTVIDTTEATATGTTGANTNSGNTGDTSTTTGDAGIGVTSVKQDNTAVIGGSAGLDVNGYNSDYIGDLLLGFGGSTANLGSGGSYQAINDTTGSDSTNTIDLNTQLQEVNEVQNDGQIQNLLNLLADTGNNTANGNTGDGSITTGDANIAATLVNLLNTTVINGSLMVSVADIFGDLMGNIVLPNLSALAAALFGATTPTITAGNEQTGADSTNTIDVDLTQTEDTKVANEADITTTVNANAITGQNDTIGNTGGGVIETGDGKVSASNISLANTTIEGGNWGLVIVNAFNRWLGFLVGDNGEVRALSQEETINAINQNTGADSDNTIDISQEQNRTTNVTNNAEILNDVTASAITGQNEASGNTGQGSIATGDASIEATAVNIANTTVKDGSLFIAVVNIFGDWFGDLLYGGNSLLASAGLGSQQVNADASNQNTGSGSENTIDIDIDRSQETAIDNDANIITNLHANIDTGTNKTNQNTLGGEVKTGDGVLALHSRTLANLTGIALDPALGLTISGLNDTTGFDSKNTIKAELNDKRIISVDNFADIDTIFASLVNTGNNEANQNTVGGRIITGNIDATAGIQNLVNRVILALAGGMAPGTTIDLEFLNRLTGALSENSNEAEVNYDFLADIDNEALIDNLLKLLFNTGGNQANENTLGAATATGRICFAGEVSNMANQNTFGLSSLWSVDADNDADVNNDANISATTGNNQMNDNTSGGQAGEADGCPIAQAPAPIPAPQASPTPTPGPAAAELAAGQPDQPSGMGGGAPEAGKVAAAAAPEKPGKLNGGKILRRFPVAGSVVESRWLADSAKPIWPAFVIGAVGILGLAYHLDRQARRRQLLTNLG